MKLSLRRISACAVGAALLTGGCRNAEEPPKPPPPVTVAHPAERPVTEYVDLTGTVGASKSVQLVARVSGYLDSVNFTDGSFVDAGQLLFLIEPQQYEQQVALNEANLLQCQSEYDRQLELVKQQATSKSNVEKWLSSRDQAKAQLELAKINLGYTRVTAPFAGRIGARQVDPGNLVGASSATVLATVEQLQPIYVNFSMNERDALHFHQEMQRLGMAVKANVGKTPVLVGLHTEKGYPHQGVLDFVDNEISTSTGTIALRGLLKNEDRALFPGLFARVRIPLGEPHPMLVIPNASIGNDQQGDFVYVVEAGDVVARRSIERGPLTDEGCAIRSGLTAQDQVIVNGLLNARAGEKVTPTQAAPAAPAAKP
jgi:RND family efflux transporter MFP subunit